LICDHFDLDLQKRHAQGTRWSIRGLSPSQLAAFYRWFILIPANVYPLLTPGEFAGRFVRIPGDADVNAETVESWITQGAYAGREELWWMLEKELANELEDGEYLAGTEQPTLLDIFFAMMAHFMPHIGQVGLDMKPYLH
jgi:glutathione S-transferase